MNRQFAEALAPLAARMGRVVRSHEVLRVAGMLSQTGDPDAEARAAAKEVLKWASKQAGTTLPAAAWAGETFELPLAGRDPAAVRMTTAEADIWAFRIHRPDRDVPGRAWTTEVVLGHQPGDPVRFSARLSAATEEPEFAIDPAVPGFVVQIASVIGLRVGSQTASKDPQELITAEDAGTLLDRLTDPGRKLPLVALSVAEDAPGPALDARELARRLVGLAHVVTVHPEASWELTRRLDKRLSVFQGAVRIYMSGFEPAADPFAHPLILGHRLSDETARQSGARWLAETAAQASLRATRLGHEVLTFAAIRAAEVDLRSRALGASATLTEQLDAARQQVLALRAQVETLTQENHYYVSEADSERARAEAAEARAHGAEWRILDLAGKLRAQGGDPDAEVDLPDSWSDFAAWCDRYLAGRVVLAPRARRMVRDPLYNAPQTAARSLVWLATTGRDRFQNGGGSLSNIAIEAGIENAPCGADSFNFDWEGRRMQADWHVKTGGNKRAPEVCLRIYYAFDQASGQIVVAEMPAHRRTGAT